MNEPPRKIDGRDVVCYSQIDERHKPTGNCRQVMRGEIQGSAAGLIICQMPEESCDYLYGCDADWNVVSDTWHPTLDDAKNQAEFEYSRVSSTWQTDA